MKNLFIALAMLFAPLLHGAVQPSIGGTELMKANGARGTNTALFGATTNNGPLNLASGATNFGAAPIRSDAFNLGGTNLPVQIDAQIDAKFLGSNGNFIGSSSGAGTNTTVRGLTLPTLTASRPAILNGSGNLTNATGTPDGTKFLRDDGTLAVPPGAAQTPWASDINSAGFNLTNSSILIGRLATPYANSGGVNLYGFGVEPLAGGDFTGSDSLFSYGTLSLKGATMDNGDYVYAFGQEVLKDASITNSESTYGFGRQALHGAEINDAQSIYAYGNAALNSSIFRTSAAFNSPGDINAYGSGAGQSSFFEGASTIYAYGYNALRTANLIDSTYIFAFGASVLEDSLLTNSANVYAFGQRAGKGLAGEFLDVYMFGTDSIVDTNSQMDFGGGDMRYRFRGTNGFRVESFTVNFTNIPGSGSFVGVDANGFLFRTNNPASGIATNANQFGASTTLTIKSGALLTNAVFFGQTNTGNADFSNGGTNYSATAPWHTVAGLTTGSGTEYSEIGYLDPANGTLLVETWTNVTQLVTNIYNNPWPTGLGWCYQVASSNAVGAGFVVHYTNGPCGAPATAQTPWLSDINSAGFNLTNLDTGIRIGELTPMLSRVSSEFVYAVGYKPFEDAVLDNVSTIYAFGDYLFLGTTITNTSQNIYAYGNSIAGSALISDVENLYGFGLGNFSSSTITSVQRVFAFGNVSLVVANLFQSGDIYTFGRDILNESDVIASENIYGFGNSALYQANLTNSFHVYAFGFNAGAGLSGEFNNVYMFGTDSIVDTNSQMDFGGGDMRYRFRGTNGFRVESFTVNFTNLPGSGDFVAIDANGFLFRTSSPASTNAASVNNYYNTNIFNNWTIFQSNVVFNNRVTFNSTVTFATNTFFSQIIATNAAFTVNTNLGAGGALTNFTVNLDGDNNLFIDGGTTNVNLRAMNWAAGLAKTVNLVITNRTATVRTISFDGITNNWLGMGTITGPIQLTNGLYLSIKSMGGSNMWYGAQYTGLPTQ